MYICQSQMPDKTVTALMMMVYFLFLDHHEFMAGSMDTRIRVDVVHSVEITEVNTLFTDEIPEALICCTDFHTQNFILQIEIIAFLPKAMVLWLVQLLDIQSTSE